MPAIKTAPDKSMFRTDAARQAPARVDREGGVIYGAAMMQAGDLNSGDVRPFTADAETLQQVEAMGNAARNGIKARFTHPNMSNDGMGSYLGRWTNFRIDGDTVRADLHIADAAYTSPQGDLGNYVMDLAEQDPEAFGISMATQLDQQSYAEFEATYNRESDREKRKSMRWPMRFTAIKAGDVVDSPAATRTGLFSLTEADPRNLPAQATALLDTYFSDAPAEAIRERINGFLNRYLASRGDDMPEPTPAEVVTTETPAAPATPAADLSAADTVPAVETATADLAAAERQRCLQIQALCNLAGVPDKFSVFVNGNFTVEGTQAALRDLSAQKGSVVQPAAEPQPDPNAKYKAEFAAHRGSITVTEEQWIRSRRIDDGLDPLQK
jgi:hypothetical protein